MIQDTKIGVIGGDVRSFVTASELAKKGFCVWVYAVPGAVAANGLKVCNDLYECTKGACVLILGIPYSTDTKHINCPLSVPSVSIETFFESVSENTLVLGGRFDSDAYSIAERTGVRLIDYFDSEELSILNAVPTAEGALELAMKELDITLHSSNALILGYGRIAKLLARDLHSLGANVTVAARKESDRTFAQVLGYDSCDIDGIAKTAPACDVIFNTVPSLLLTENILKDIPKQTLIIDLASKPGGVDMKAAKALSSRVIWALSLPGKVAPVSAGRAIACTVSNILYREGIL